MLKTIDQIPKEITNILVQQYNKTSIKDLISQTNLSKQEIISILLNNRIKLKQEDILSLNIEDKKIAIISDTHIGSIYENINYLNKVYEFCTSKGITTILHAGDLLQSNIKNVNKKYQNPYKQIEHLVSLYPQDKNITNYITFGNHDFHILCKITDSINNLYLRNDLQPLGVKRTYIKWQGKIISVIHECPKYRITIPNLETIINIHGHRHNLKYTNTSIYVPTLSDNIMTYSNEDIPLPGFLILYLENNELNIESYSIDANTINKGLVFTKHI